MWLRQCLLVVQLSRLDLQQHLLHHPLLQMIRVDHAARVEVLFLIFNVWRQVLDIFLMFMLNVPDCALFRPQVHLLLIQLHYAGIDKRFSSLSMHGYGYFSSCLHDLAKLEYTQSCNHHLILFCFLFWVAVMEACMNF